MARERHGASSGEPHRDVVTGEPFARGARLASFEPIGGEEFDGARVRDATAVCATPRPAPSARPSGKSDKSACHKLQP